MCSVVQNYIRMVSFTKPAVIGALAPDATQNDGRDRAITFRCVSHLPILRSDCVCFSATFDVTIHNKGLKDLGV
jgi:hypothetical protein